MPARFLLTAGLLACHVFAGSLVDLQDMLHYTADAITKAEPILLHSSPYIQYLMTPLIRLRTTTVTQQHSSIVASIQHLLRRHESTKPLMPSYISEQLHSLTQLHLQKFNLPLLRELLSQTMFPATDNFINYIAQGINQWGRIPAFGVFPEEDRLAKLHPQMPNEYHLLPPPPSAEYAKPRIHVAPEDEQWLLQNLEEEIKKNWHIQVPFNRLKSTPSEAFVVTRAGKRRAVYNDAGPACKNLYTYTSERAGLMSFKTITTVLQLVLSDPTEAVAALATPVWQSAKTLWQQLEASRNNKHLLTAEQYRAARHYTQSANTSRIPRLALVFLDLKAAYRQFPVSNPMASSYKTWSTPKQHWIYTVSPLLMFGSTPSIYFFCVFAVVFTHILALFGILATQYVDDITIYVEEENLEITLRFVTLLLECLGLPIADDKTARVCPGGQGAKALGYVYKIAATSDKVYISLPDDKIGEILQLVSLAQTALCTRSLAPELIEKLVGNLIWASQLTRFGILRILTGSLSTWTIPPFFRNAIQTTTARNNLKDLLDAALYVFTNAPPSMVIDAHAFKKPPNYIFSDASLENNTAVYGAFIYTEHRKWTFFSKTADLSSLDPADRAALSIDILELLAAKAAICPESVKNRRTIFYIDNTSASYMMLKGRGQGASRMKILKSFMTLIQEFGMIPVFKYVPSRQNLGDALTRDADFMEEAVKQLNAVRVEPYGDLLNTLQTRSPPLKATSYQYVLFDRN